MNNIVLMEEESFKKLSEKLDALKSEVRKLNLKSTGLVEDHWLTSDDVCTYLGIRRRTLQNMRDNKTISFSKHGKKIYYKASDIEKYLEQNYTNHNSKK